tara:strand:+ start:866 stop:1045 length:180 start_codon:yes stop_codon:yes gene_type:complete
MEPKNPNKKEDYPDDYRDMNKSIRKKNKVRRAKEKQMLEYLVNEDEGEVEEYYDNFEKW